MKMKEIKKLTEDQLHKNLDKFKKDLFNLRFQKNNGQITDPSKFKEIKKLFESWYTGIIGLNISYKLMDCSRMQ